jgi:hypothetical protein
MTAKEDIKKIASRATEYVKNFFVSLEEEQKKILPPILKKPGTWMAQYDEASIGFFFLTMDELKRATKNQNKGFPAFPGFIISDDKRPAGIQVWVSVPGTCHFYSSNHTKNMYVFSVKPGDSFTVVDHFQEIRDSSGEEFKYRVDLAFVIGIYPGEEWPLVEKRLSELLDHTMGVWRKLQ